MQAEERKMRRMDDWETSLLKAPRDDESLFHSEALVRNLCPTSSSLNDRQPDNIRIMTRNSRRSSRGHIRSRVGFRRRRRMRSSRALVSLELLSKGLEVESLSICGYKHRAIFSQSFEFLYGAGEMTNSISLTLFTESCHEWMICNKMLMVQCQSPVKRNDLFDKKGRTE